MNSMLTIEESKHIIISLSVILGLDLRVCEVGDFSNLFSVYVDVFLGHKLSVPGCDILDKLQEQHSQWINNKEMARNVYAYCMLNIYNHGFTLEKEEDALSCILFSNIIQDNAKIEELAAKGYDGLKGFVVSNKINLNHTLQVSIPTDSNFYFENIDEFLVFCYIHKPNRTINWLKGDDYLTLYNEGYQLVENKQYIRAIQTYLKCFTINPIALSARFEIAVCCTQLKQYAIAKQVLMETVPYLLKKESIATFYRHLGFIAIEELRYDVAFACLKYSLIFDYHEVAQHELEYIKLNRNESYEDIDIEKAMNDVKVPVITMEEYENKIKDYDNFRNNR